MTHERLLNNLEELSIMRKVFSDKTAYGTYLHVFDHHFEITVRGEVVLHMAFEEGVPVLTSTLTERDLSSMLEFLHSLLPGKGAKVKR